MTNNYRYFKKENIHFYRIPVGDKHTQTLHICLNLGEDAPKMQVLESFVVESVIKNGVALINNLTFSDMSMGNSQLLPFMIYENHPYDESLSENHQIVEISEHDFQLALVTALRVLDMGYSLITPAVE